ncbi:MAG TPA: methionine synthase [Dehalococcoidia bacterium]|nr:methionine synthase [Dehalococcoidia bacterium]
MVAEQTRTQSQLKTNASMTLVTTAVGSFARPDELTKARAKFARDEISREELDRLEKEATEYWIRAQEKVGLDVLVHGEMERGDMVAYFSGEKGGLPIQGMKLGGLVRSYGNRYYHKPIIHDKLEWPGPMTVDMWKYAQSLTDRPVKGMLTGAYTMVEWSFDEHYPSRRDAVLDMAKVIRKEVEALAAAGAKYIQIDEPAIHTRPEADFDVAVEAMHVMVDGVDAEFHTHICYGEIEKIWEPMMKLPVKQIHLAFKNTDFAYLDLVREQGYDETKDVGVGVTDVHTRFIESVDEVKDGLRRVLEFFPANRVWVLPDCGLKTRTVEESEAKLKVMTDAVRDVKQELGLE